ncbi:Long-chain-fatty-acid--CoA ligase [hydrothermal vent metagenome]|uniref:Long-chain-fatty-acid--CoA ligase n=1 Tax=hydrothermal vent metagenome TaxID=652676 RepID=A0A3B0RHF9_9ZZZZ
MTINGDTIPRAFFELEPTHSGRLKRERLALKTRQGDELTEISMLSLQEQVRELSYGLMAIGIKPGERIAIDLPNCPEWLISDLAITSIGAVTVPIYTTLGKDEKIFILKDSKAVAIILPAERKAAFKPSLLQLTEIRHVLSAGRAPEGEREEEDINDFSLHGISIMGRVAKDSKGLLERMEATSPDDPFSIIYTSGTTGIPKGAVISHANIISNIKASLEVIDVRPTDLYLSYLQLSHAFERMIHYLLLLSAVPIAYSKGLTTVGSDLEFFRPSFMIGIPFFFEKIKKKIMQKAAASGTIKRTLFKAAFASKQSKNKDGSIANSLVFKKIKEKIGPNIRYFVSGGAPLSIETAEFFNKIGLPIIEGYGLTETSPVIAVNSLKENRPGTVGKALPGTTVKLGEDGEILIKGPGVMKGYHNKPKETAEAFCDGWFHTGDTGRIDDDGFITITDRKKDIIITSAGKNIAPQKIETILKADEFIKEVIIFGDRQTHIVALVVPDSERLEDLRKMATAKDGPTLLTDPVVHTFFEKKIRERLKDLAPFEHVKKFALIADDMTLDAGELTPTHKVKRDRIGQRYSNLLDSLYGEDKK